MILFKSSKISVILSCNDLDLLQIFTLTKLYLMQQRVFCILIDYRGHHRKGVAILNAT